MKHLSKKQLLFVEINLNLSFLFFLFVLLSF